MNHKQRFLTSMGVAAGLIAGGGAGLVLQSSSSAGASAEVAALAPPTTDGGATGSVGTATPPAPAHAGARLQKILQPLVDNGTLTQAQVDAIIAKIDAARPVDGEGPGRGGHRGRRAPGLRIESAKVAKFLGVSTADLRSALRDGTTLAAYAQTKGKTGQGVIDLLVADTKTHLDKKVADKSLTQAQADTKLAEATTRITDLVDNGRPAHPASKPATAPGQPATTPGGPATTTAGEPAITVG